MSPGKITNWEISSEIGKVLFLFTVGTADRITLDYFKQNKRTDFAEFFTVLTNKQTLKVLNLCQSEVFERFV
jgi:hypothetical protein